MKGVRSVILTFSASVLSHAAFACGVCIEAPETSFSDLVLSADAVVLAREDLARPFRFGVATVLAGSHQGGAEIPFLVDSTTRRKLALNTADSVLILRQGLSWKRAGYANAELRKLVEDILILEAHWEAAPSARFGFFEALLRSPDEVLRHLAVDELSRAPYSLVRNMAEPIAGTHVRQALADRTQVPWQSFYILMLGLSDRSKDHDLIRARIATASHVGGNPHLEAWATAFVEYGGKAAVVELVQNWFEQPHRQPEALRSVIAALATHARFGDAALTPMIVEAMTELARSRQDVVGSIATALGQIGDYSHGGLIRSAITGLPAQEARSIDASELFAASAYIHRARLKRAAHPLGDLKTQ